LVAACVGDASSVLASAMRENARGYSQCLMTSYL
jgi:hypothetical protein